MRTWAWLASMGLALGLVACSTDDGGGDGGSGEGGENAGGSGTGATGTGATGTGATGTGATGTGATGTGATGGGGGATSCADEPTSDDCFDCCDAENPAALDAINAIYLDACICGATAPCATDCAAECADPNLDVTAPCGACIDGLTADPNNIDACYDTTFNDCAADASCAPIVECWASC